MVTVLGGLVLRQCRALAVGVTTHMAGDALVAVQKFHRPDGEAYVQLLSNELVGGAVEVLFDLDVVVRSDAALGPLAVLEARCRQGLQGRPVQGLELRATAAR